MEAAMSEPRELASEQSHTPSDGLTCNRPARPDNMSSLLTHIADTLSNLQQQQPLPFPPLSPSSTTLPALPTLPNFDPSALLNSLTSQGSGIADSLLDSLSRVHGASPLLSSTSAPPSVAPPSTTIDTPLATQGTTAAANIGPPLLSPQLPGLPAGLDNFMTTEDDSLENNESSEVAPNPPAVALACTVSTGHEAPALPPAILPDTIFSHDNSGLLTGAPPPLRESTSPPTITGLPLPLPHPLPRTGPRGALAINGVPAVTATVVARSVTASTVLPPPVGLLASALPTTGTSSQESPLPSSSTSPPAFTATPLTTTSLPLDPPTLSTSAAVAPSDVATPPVHQLSALPSVQVSNEPIGQGSPSNELTPSFGQESHVDELITQGPPPDVQTNEQISNSPSCSLLVPTANEVIDLGPPLTLEEMPNKHQPSPPSLHANEELLSEDSDEVEMETSIPATSLPLPLPSANAVGSRSDSASPYTDDASFASFVAGEAHDSGSVMDEDHFSPSPSPLPSVSQSIDALVNQLHSQPATSSSSQLHAQFGVTAFSPRNPILPPPTAPPAPLDMTVQNFPKRSKYAHRAAMTAMHPYHRTRGGGVSVAKTMELLKAVLQSSFNMEVKRLCDDYLSLYRQAAGNIRENTGDVVPEATLRLLVNKMLEEAQHGYQKEEWEFPSSKLPRNEKVGVAKVSPMANKKVKGEKGEARYGPPKRTRRPPAEHHGSEKTSWKWSMDKKRVDPGKWQPDTLSTDTSFVLGVNVNKALGHGANRGKVYYLHPELFKYACDGDDKTWLYENKFLPVHGGKAFLMIQKEVDYLVTSDSCYKDSDEVLGAVKKLQEFKVPQFMLDKMKVFMRSVQGYFAQEASTGQSNDSHQVTAGDTSQQKC